MLKIHEKGLAIAGKPRAIRALLRELLMRMEPGAPLQSVLDEAGYCGRLPSAKPPHKPRAYSAAAPTPRKKSGS